MSGPDSLETFLTFMSENEIDDDKIYRHLARLNQPRLEILLGRLDRVDSLKNPGGRGSKKWKGRHSALKGKIYERIISLLVDGVRCFDQSTNVTTTTNELDVLITLGPSASFVPALREWGTHCICECKYHTTYVKNDWVSKLNTVLSTHGAHVGLLFSRKGIAQSGNGKKIQTTLHLLAAGNPARFLLCLDREDLDSLVNGKNVLQVISERFVAVRAGTRKLSLLAS